MEVSVWFPCRAMEHSCELNCEKRHSVDSFGILAAEPEN